MRSFRNFRRASVENRPPQAQRRRGKGLFIIVALILLLAGRPCLWAAAPAAILWVPPESFSDWAGLSRLFEKYEELRLTAGLAPEMLAPEGEKTLGPWIQKGRLEVALRLSGDPILPLIAGHPEAPRPQDPANRIALSREKHRLIFGSLPAGLVPGGGAVSPELFPAFKAMGLSWVAAGDYAGSSANWAASSGVVLVPFRPLTGTGPDAGSISQADIGPVIIDEADGLAPEGSGLKLIALLAEKKRGWATVSEAVKGASTSEAPAVFAKPSLESSVKELTPGTTGNNRPAWGGVEPWSQGASLTAWKIYGETALTLERYQNSGTADLKALEDATELLYRAQAGRYYRLQVLAKADAERLDREFRGHLIAVYRKIRLTPPEALYHPVFDQGETSAASGGEAGDQPRKLSTDIHFSQGSSWISFENPAGSLARAPEQDPSQPEAARPESLWRILGLRVETGGRGMDFVYRMERLQNLAPGVNAAPKDARDGLPNTADPAGLGGLLLDTYIDLNHVLGAGSTALLEGRQAYAQARDAWEYAITASAWGAFLYRSNPAGAPFMAGKLALAADPEKGELRVSVPAALLRGNPLRWGFIVAAMAADPGTTAKPPPKPMPGNSLLGILAPLEQQKSVLEGGRARPRLAAVRAKTP